MLHLVVTESALETIPQNLWENTDVRRHSKKLRKHPRFILLDRSYHHTAMKKLSKHWKRGRPDIVHFLLLEALGSPLNKEGLLRVYVHTINNYVIEMNPSIRLPKNYNRFTGLIEQLFELGRVPPKGPPLLKLKRQTLSKLMININPTRVVAFSRKGVSCTLQEVVSRLSSGERPCVIIGGFPHGNFVKSTQNLVDEVVSIDKETLEAWTVASRLIYEYERFISLPKKRLNI